MPPEQDLSEYVFFADPTYPETSLVLVHGRAGDGPYKAVVLDCLGTVTGWQPVDAGEFEYARVDLVTGDFAAVGACSTGRHEITSAAPFGLWVWGRGTPRTATFTANVSYGHPGGMNVTPINDVIPRALSCPSSSERARPGDGGGPPRAPATNSDAVRSGT